MSHGGSYYNYLVQNSLEGYDSQFGGYYFFGTSTTFGSLGYYYVAGAVTVDDSMAVDDFESVPGSKNWGKGFDNFNQAKKYLGSPGEGNDWHHIVEQSQIKKSGFDSIVIHNTRNLVPVSKDIHTKISAYYSSIDVKWSRDMIVRNWLAGKDFKYQYDIGMKVFREFTE